MSQLTDNLNTIAVIKENIKDAIENKGVDMSGVSFASFPDKIGEIQTGSEPTGTITIVSNGTYDVTDYASASVSVGTDYRNKKGTISGLTDLGWSADSIGYAETNLQHYIWQNLDYVVSQANKDLYGVVNKNNKNDYKTNTDMKYLPMFDTRGVTDFTNYFYQFSNIVAIPLLDTSSAGSMYAMFDTCTSLENIPLLNTSSVTNMRYMFSGCRSLKSIPPLDTGSATNMYSMFNGCSSLETIPALDTSSVTSMHAMFSGCRSLKTIPTLDTGSVTDMYSMFDNCSSLETIPALDTGSVTDFSYMFQNCTSLIEVNGIDFSSVTTSPSGFLYGTNVGTTITKFKVNGRINFSWTDSYGLSRLTNIDFDSIKSILQAMDRTTNTNAKTMKFNVVVADPNNELTTLMSSCALKGWTITGLIIPTGDPVINYTSKDGNIVAPKQLPAGYSVVTNVYEGGSGTMTFNKHPLEIGQYMFQGKTQLDTIEIPDEVTRFGYACFADGCGITSITVPANVTVFDSYVFSGASSLVEVTMVSAIPPTVGAGTFNAHNANLVIRVPAAAVDTYKNANNWRSYASLIVGY